MVKQLVTAGESLSSKVNNNTMSSEGEESDSGAIFHHAPCGGLMV